MRFLGWLRKSHSSFDMAMKTAQSISDYTGWALNIIREPAE